MDLQTQLEELDSIRNIFFREEFQVLHLHQKGEAPETVFWAYVKVPEDYKIQYVVFGNTAELIQVNINYLPPIRLTLTLPRKYPSKTPPKFLISCDWLTRADITKLCKKLDDIWNEYGCREIIYSWCSFLKFETLSFLGYEEVLDFTELNNEYACFLQMTKREMEGEVVDEESIEIRRFRPGVRASYYLKHPRRVRFDRSKIDSRIVTNFSTTLSPLRYLEIYAADRAHLMYLRSFFLCNICFSDKQGQHCFKFLNCEHVFCQDCVRAYFTAKIQDGAVQCIQCPEDKCTTEVLPHQIKEMVSEELYEKYDDLLLKNALNTCSDIIYCPRQICQYPVSREPEENMAICANCKYVFCTFCRMGYHGVEPCRIKTAELKRIVEEYENASEAVKRELEIKFGKQRLETLVNNKKAEEWIRENSKPCPKCKVAIEKSYGCNKMLCWRCNTPFCWLCGAELDPAIPYSHYVDPNSRCAERLFHLVNNFDDEYDEVVVNLDEYHFYEVEDYNDIEYIYSEEEEEEEEEDEATEVLNGKAAGRWEVFTLLDAGESD